MASSCSSCWALIRLEHEAYGVPIAEAIEKSSGRNVALGSVYITLERLQRRGFVSSRLGEPTAELAAGRKRTFASPRRAFEKFGKHGKR
jgi:PadR family transcriptional regulator